MNEMKNTQPTNWAAYRAVTNSIDEWNRRVSGGRAVMGQRAVAAMSAVRRGDNPWRTRT